MAKRRPFSEEYRQEAVRLVESGQPVAQVASDLGIGRSTLWRWVESHRPRPLEEPPAPESVHELQKENARLRKQVALLEEEKEILKKATAFFARETR